MEYVAFAASAIELSRVFIKVTLLVFGSIPAEAKSIQRDIEILSVLLKQLQRNILAYPPDLKSIADDILKDCDNTCRELKAITLAMQHKRSSRISKMPKLQSMKSQLEHQKSTLQITLIAANYATIPVSPDNYEKIQRDHALVEELMDRSKNLAQVREIEEVTEALTTDTNSTIDTEEDRRLVRSERFSAVQDQKEFGDALNTASQSEELGLTLGLGVDTFGDFSLGLHQPPPMTARQATGLTRRSRRLEDIYPRLSAFLDLVNRRWLLQSLPVTSSLRAITAPDNPFEQPEDQLTFHAPKTLAYSSFAAMMPASNNTVTMTATRGWSPAHIHDAMIPKAEMALALRSPGTMITTLDQSPARSQLLAGLSSVERRFINDASDWPQIWDLTLGNPSTQPISTIIHDGQRLQKLRSLRWDTQRKRRDKLLIRHFVGLDLRSQSEELWDELIFDGPAWTSIPSHATSRAVLKRMKYDFQEDGGCFHIFEELTPRDVVEICSQSLV